MAYITGIDPGLWHSTAQFGLGTRGVTMGPQGAKEYTYVRLRNETAAIVGTIGDPVGWLADPANDTEVNTVVTDVTDASTTPVCAGLIVGSPDGTLTLNGVTVSNIAGAQNTAYFGWVQSRGYAVVNAALAGSPAAGDPLFLSTTDKTLSRSLASGTPMNTISAICINVASKLVRLCCD
jgi:hypothetical protein